MENGYLGGVITGGTLLLFALAYWQFRRPGMHRSLDNEFAATVTGFLLTTALAIGISLFAGNAYLTDTFSTIVSAGVVLATLMMLVITIVRTRTAPENPGLEPCTSAPFTPETQVVNTNKAAFSRSKSRRKAA